MQAQSLGGLIEKAVSRGASLFRFSLHNISYNLYIFDLVLYRRIHWHGSSSRRSSTRHALNRRSHTASKQPQMIFILPVNSLCLPPAFLSQIANLQTATSIFIPYSPFTMHHSSSTFLPIYDPTAHDTFDSRLSNYRPSTAQPRGQASEVIFFTGINPLYRIQYTYNHPIHPNSVTLSESQLASSITSRYPGSKVTRVQALTGTRAHGHRLSILICISDVLRVFSTEDDVHIEPNSCI